MAPVTCWCITTALQDKEFFSPWFPVKLTYIVAELVLPFSFSPSFCSPPLLLSFVLSDTSDNLKKELCCYVVLGSDEVRIEYKH